MLEIKSFKSFLHFLFQRRSNKTNPGSDKEGNGMAQRVGTGCELSTIEEHNEDGEEYNYSAVLQLLMT